ncbi:MAG: hypothetical protein GC149_13310 [Gammaproteobacteria bacterium]|nr:hypothetical protein [Gammaproteobacteria bacterium]
MADKTESNDLLDALESIKGLLEKSEVKLNAAKKSIAQAAPASMPPLPEVEEIFDDEEKFDFPVLNEIVIPAADEGGKATVDIEVLKAFLDEMQKSVEKNMRDTIMKAVVQAESDIKKQLRAYLNQLRKMLNEAD